MRFADDEPIEDGDALLGDITEMELKCGNSTFSYMECIECDLAEEVCDDADLIVVEGGEVLECGRDCGIFLEHIEDGSLELFIFCCAAGECAWSHLARDFKPIVSIRVSDIILEFQQLHAYGTDVVSYRSTCGEVTELEEESMVV